MTEPEIKARVAEIMARPYRKVIHGTLDEGFLGEVAEFSGCITAGDTEAEALEMLRDAMEGWLTVRLEEDLPIPEPEGDEHFSGRVLVRMPPRLHGRISRQARDQGVSLNQWIVTLLAEANSGARPVKQLAAG